MSRPPIMTEADLAAKIVDRYKADSWDVYQEVSISGRGRADIVAVKDGVLHVIEAKKPISSDVLRQAEAWAPFCSASFVACAPTAGVQFLPGFKDAAAEGGEA